MKPDRVDGDGNIRKILNIEYNLGSFGAISQDVGNNPEFLGQKGDRLFFDVVDRSEWRTLSMNEFILFVMVTTL